MMPTERLLVVVTMVMVMSVERLEANVRCYACAPCTEMDYYSSWTDLSFPPAREVNMLSRARDWQAGQLGPAVQLGSPRQSDQGEIILVAPVIFVQNKVALSH